jgi:hypothetical protein
MDPNTDTVRQLQYSSRNRYDQRRYFEKMTRRNHSYRYSDTTKFNDNRKKYFDRQPPRPKHYYENEDVFTLIMSQAQAEGNGLFEKDFVAQPDLTEIGKTGNSLMLQIV